jgi:phosphonate transport system substrate-binding protein
MLRRTLCAAACALLLVAGCSPQEQQSAPPKARSYRTVLIGLVPEEGIFANAARYRQLVRYLSRRTGYDIRITVFPHYDDVVDSFASKKIEAAFFGSYTYVLAHERVDAQVIARPEWRDGSSTYRGLLIVRRDSGIRSIEDMRGKRFVFVDRDTTAGYVLPLAYFRRHGVDYRSWFRETYFAGTHADAVRDVLNREADAGAVKSTVFERMVGEEPRIGSDIVVLERSPEMPENGLVVRDDLEASVRERLTEALLTMQDDRDGALVLISFGARRFIRTSDEDYRGVRDYVRSAGIDLRTGRETAGK